MIPNYARIPKFGICFKEKANSLGSGYLQPNSSSLLRKVHAIKLGKGKTIFHPLILNIYGKNEGILGGYGISPKNRFL